MKRLLPVVVATLTSVFARDVTVDTDDVGSYSFYVLGLVSTKLYRRRVLQTDYRELQQFGYRPVIGADILLEKS